MKIAIDVSQMCYIGTGVARYVYGLTQALLKEDSPHTFILFAGTLRQRSFYQDLQQQIPWNKARWKILPLPPRFAGKMLNTIPLPFEWLTGPVDVIHTSDWSEPFSYVPIVTTVHDLVFKIYPETVDPLILATQQKRLRRIVRDTSHVIVDSKSTKNDLMKIYAMPTERITVIYPGIDQRYFPQSNNEIDRVKKKYNLPDQYILSLGTQEPRKNLARLIEACNELKLPLVLTGKYGWGTPITTSKVISLGYVDESDLPALYSGANVFAYPSLYEGFGFPVLEAMACGTPIVTSNISSLPELVGQAGVLVDPQNIFAITAGIKLAIQEKEQRSVLGILQAKKFTWEKTAKKVLEVYETIANRH